MILGCLLKCHNNVVLVMGQAAEVFSHYSDSSSFMLAVNCQRGLFISTKGSKWLKIFDHSSDQSIQSLGRIIADRNQILQPRLRELDVLLSQDTVLVHRYDESVEQLGKADAGSRGHDLLSVVI